MNLHFRTYSRALPLCWETHAESPALTPDAWHLKPAPLCFHRHPRMNLHFSLFSPIGSQFRAKVLFLLSLRSVTRIAVPPLLRPHRDSPDRTPRDQRITPRPPFQFASLCRAARSKPAKSNISNPPQSPAVRPSQSSSRATRRRWRGQTIHQDRQKSRRMKPGIPRPLILPGFHEPGLVGAPLASPGHHR